MRTTPIALSLIACSMLVFAGCLQKPPQMTQTPIVPENVIALPTPSAPAAVVPGAPVWAVNPAGDTVQARFPAPEGFVRTQEAPGSFGTFLRGQKLEPDGSPVLLYDGREKGGDAAVAVLSLDVGGKDLQQCADAALRLRAEYLFAQGRFDAISFHLTNGFLFPYAKYRAGYRLQVDGNETTLVKTASPDNSYAVFRKYCDMLFTYAGTLSLSQECAPVEDSDLQIGDLFIQGGSPGHCVIVADLCENPATGEKAFLLAQSYMPAQQIHVLKNPARDEPWYYASELSYPFATPQWTFEAGSHKRFPQ